MLASQDWYCSTDLVTSLVGYLFVCIVCHLAHRAIVAMDYIFLVQSITASAGAQLTTKRETSRALPCGSLVSSENPAYETAKGHVLIILLFPRNDLRGLAHPRSSSQNRHFKIRTLDCYEY
jgi:hypothetical protein